MADITINAAYGSVVEDDEHLFIGFAEGEEEDGAYVLFRQSLGVGPVWFEVNDESFGADDAVESVIRGPNGLTITIHPHMIGRFGWAGTVEVSMVQGSDGLDDAVAALRGMAGPLMVDAEN